MAWWFAHGILRGIITTRYPAATDPSTATLPTPPAFRPGLLTPAIADELAAACPNGALRRHGGNLRYDVGACTACGRCARVGGAAVVPSGQFELAATAREQLVKTIPVRGGAE